jgi:glycine betaine/proline transport system ATP-binding protein
MKPANAYVEEFTQDVPRVKVITAGDIMAPAAPGLDAAVAVPGAMTLERLMPRFGEGLNAIPVKGESGSVIGQVTPQAVLAALAGEHDEGERA